jgi:hypothetical protein
MDGFMKKNNTSAGENSRISLKATLDTILDGLYEYHGSIHNPEVEKKMVWAAPLNLPKDVLDLGEYFLHYFQSQGRDPTPNECVTTSVVMSMNIMEDRVASGNMQPIQYISKLLLKDYTRDLDALRILGWKYRFSSDSLLPGMMTPWQAVLALKDHAATLKAKYGRSYKIQLKPWCTINDLINNLKQGKIMLIHGAWRIPLTASTNRYLAFIGGMPHTMVLVGYEPEADQWFLLDPGLPPTPTFRRMKTEELLTKFWGRKFLFYPPRFSITIITPDY